MAKGATRLIKSKALSPISRQEPPFLLKYKRFFFFMLGITVLGTLLTYSTLKVVEKAPLWLQGLSQRMGFVVDDVMVEGRQNTSQKELLEALQIKRGDSMFVFSPAGLKEKLEKLPWIRSAIVERRFPQAFYIHLAERKPLAVWQFKGKFYLLDREGKAISCPLEHFSEGLLLVVGEQAPQHVKKLLAVLENVLEIKQRVVAAMNLRSGRWDLHLDNKWILKLPENGVEQALRHFLSFEYKYRFLNQKVMTVDLRLGDTLTVRLTPEAAKEGRTRKLRTTIMNKEA